MSWHFEYSAVEAESIEEMLLKGDDFFKHTGTLPRLGDRKELYLNTSCAKPKDRNLRELMDAIEPSCIPSQRPCLCAKTMAQSHHCSVNENKRSDSLLEAPQGQIFDHGSDPRGLFQPCRQGTDWSLQYYRLASLH
jgi:hypothetical protein